MMHDKAELPNAVELEAAVLGSIMLNNDLLGIVQPIMKEEHLYEQAHRVVFNAILSSIEAGRPATPPTLIPYMPKEKIGDISFAEYLVRIVGDGAIPAAGLKGAALAIVDMAERRRVISIATTAIDECYAMSPDRYAPAIAATVEQGLSELRAESPREEGPGTASAAAYRLMSAAENRKPARVIELPMREIKRVLNGNLEAGNLYGLLSSSGEGKTSLVLQILHGAAKAGHPCLMMSYDQSPDQCVMQIASQVTGISGPKLRSGDLDAQSKEIYFNALDAISRLPIEFKRCNKQEGTPLLGGYVRQFMRKFAGEKAPLVVLDHTRKVTPRDARAHEGRIASEINGWSKGMAGEHEAAWININQRSSGGMQRDNPRPISADLFGGEQAKEDYDAILWLYRPDKYKEEQLRTARDEKMREKIEERFVGWEGQAQIGALKVRYGNPNTMERLRFEAHCTRFSSVERQEFYDDSMRLI